MPNQKNPSKNAYAEAGVDTKAGAELVDKIKPAAAATKRPGVMEGLGGFGALFDIKAAGYTDPILVAGTDGVGTKVKIAIDTGKHDTIGQDLVAMCVNDLLCMGAEPLFFLDYFASSKLNVDAAASIITGIAKACEASHCALIGGETAEMPGLYAKGDYDLAGFCVGAVERNKLIDGSRIKDGDVILGLASNGLHSNGFSLVRKLVETTQGVSYDAPAPFAAETLGDVLLTPTRLYVKPILEALKLEDDDAQMIKGLVHITGGGFEENIPRVLPEGLGAVIDAGAWPYPPLFQWLQTVGNLTPDDMAQTFNCGIGMIVVCTKENAETLTETLTKAGETVYTIGQVEASDTPIAIENAKTVWRPKQA